MSEARLTVSEVGLLVVMFHVPGLLLLDILFEFGKENVSQTIPIKVVSK